MKREVLMVFLFSASVFCCYSQAENKQDVRLLFRGIVRDASSMLPLPESQIFINRTFVSASDSAGEFSFLINRRDSVLFSHLGYKPALFVAGDTLSGSEFMAGIYLGADTLLIDEVIIIPKLSNLRSAILNSPVKVNPELENAKYNLAVAAYQGKVTTGALGDPSTNYSMIKQKQLLDAREKGGIPSDRIAGISPLSVIPLAYLLLKGFPEKPPAMKKSLTRDELDQINKKYLESVRKKQ